MTASVPDDGMSTGRSFVLEVPALASQHVEALTPTGTLIGQATGFFVRDRSMRLLLVTNRHVVTGRSWPDNRAPDARKVPSVLRMSVPMASERGWTQMIVPLATADGTPRWLERLAHLLCPLSVASAAVSSRVIAAMASDCSLSASRYSRVTLSCASAALATLSPAASKR